VVPGRPPHAPGAAALVWADLKAVAPAVKSAVAVYSLKLVLDDPDKTQDVRNRLTRLSAWLDAFEPMAFGRVSVHIDSGDLVFAGHLGSDAVGTFPEP